MPPLVSFATLAGITLNRRQAIVSALLIWFVNQLYGFTIRHYPLSAIALLWGVSMGLGTVVVALIASMQPQFSRRSWAGQGLWLGISLLLGFAAYQSSILLVNQWVGMHGLTVDLFLRNLCGTAFGRSFSLPSTSVLCLTSSDYGIPFVDPKTMQLQQSCDLVFNRAYRWGKLPSLG